MDVDPRLQNLGPVDIHEFQFGPSAAYDPNYPAAVYAHGLTTNGAQTVHPHPHPHPHPQAHFVQDGQGGYFPAAAPPPQPQRQSSQPQGQSQQPSQQAQRVQQARRQQARGAARGNQLQTARNVNLNTSVDPNLRGGAVVSGRTGSVNVSNNAQARRGRLASHPATRNQQAQVSSHAQYLTQFTSPTSVQQISTTQQSPTIRQQSSGTVATTATTTTPTAPSRGTPSSIQIQFTANPQSQASAQTPASSSTPKTASVQTPNTADQLTAFNAPSTFEFVPNPPNLAEWRQRFFNITEPILLTSEQYHTYFPHVDNIYSHRSTQRYKKKPFVSHYWDCRLKGRPTGTPLSKSKSTGVGGGGGGGDGDEGDEAKEKKKRKRKTRERDLCDVKIKVTEFFGRDELEALGRLGISEDDNDPMSASSAAGAHGQLTFVLEDGTTTTTPVNNSSGQSGMGSDINMPFGVLEPLKRFPADHPGAEGRRWYMVQRVNGSGKEGEVTDEANLDHKHTLEESDRIKKNSVQRWLLAQEKEKKKQVQRSKNPTSTDQPEPSPSTTRVSNATASSLYLASGEARHTAKSHSLPAPSQITFYANSFCPFAQRIWIALELKQMTYQYVEVPATQIKDGKCTLPSLLEFNPEGIIPCIRHGNWAIWESTVILEYLEDVSMGIPMLPLGAPQLRAHCRLWTDHINRKILPFFYGLLLLPQYLGRSIVGAEGTTSDLATITTERKSMLISRLQSAITDLVNASHATGPFFLGSDMSYLDIVFAPWIIRLSRVLSYYREFPRPEVGTRWYIWVNAVEENECVKRTVSEDRSYHNVYGGVGRDGCDAGNTLGTQTRPFAELTFARQVVLQTGFGLGGDLLGHLVPEENPVGVHL